MASVGLSKISHSNGKEALTSSHQESTELDHNKTAAYVTNMNKTEKTDRTKCGLLRKKSKC